MMRKERGVVLDERMTNISQRRRPPKTSNPGRGDDYWLRRLKPHTSHSRTSRLVSSPSSGTTSIIAASRTTSRRSPASPRTHSPPKPHCSGQRRVSRAVRAVSAVRSSKLPGVSCCHGEPTGPVIMSLDSVGSRRKSMLGTS
jgi:hypothetical protein